MAVLFLRRRRCCRVGRRHVVLGRSGSGLAGGRALQHRGRTWSPGGEDRQGNRGQHEQNGGPSGRLAEYGGRATWTEGRLAALTTESSGDIGALAMLQQDHDDEEQANDNVQSRN